MFRLVRRAIRPVAARPATLYLDAVWDRPYADGTPGTRLVERTHNTVVSGRYRWRMRFGWERDQRATGNVTLGPIESYVTTA